MSLSSELHEALTFKLLTIFAAGWLDLLGHQWSRRSSRGPSNSWWHTSRLAGFLTEQRVEEVCEHSLGSRSASGAYDSTGFTGFHLKNANRIERASKRNIYLSWKCSSSSSAWIDVKEKQIKKDRRNSKNKEKMVTNGICKKLVANRELSQTNKGSDFLKLYLLAYSVRNWVWI